MVNDTSAPMNYPFSMSLINKLLLQSGSKRFIKRRFKPLLPELAYIDFDNPKLRMYLSLKDMAGPSFHLLHRPKKFMDYEEKNRLQVVAILKEIQGTPVFLDIGANIGLFSVLAATQKPEARVIAFDPDPVCYMALTQTKISNHIDNLDIIPIGLSDKTRLNHFYFDPFNHGGHSFDEANISAGGRTSVRSSLFSFNLDELLPTLDLPQIHLIKIDVQGHEWDVLRGAEKTLHKHRPKLLVECEHEHINQAAETILKLFPGYSCQCAETDSTFAISELPKIASQRFTEGWVAANYWFLP